MNCGEVTPRRRHSGDESRIPVPSSPVLKRSGSQRLSGFSPIAEHTRNGKVTSNQSPLLNRHRSLQSLNAPLSSCLSPDRDDDLDSVQSFGSNASVTSTMSQCDHASFARNGTTFSSRQKRFVVHCSPQMSPGEEYLTPTQRANRTIRRLKNLLADVQSEVIEKDQEIFRLTKEVVELRLLKAGGPAFNVNEKEEVNDGNSSVRFLPSLSTNNYKQQTTATVEKTNTEAGASCMLSCDVTSTSEDRQISSSSSSSSPTTQSSALICGAKDVHDHSELPFNGEGVSPPPVPLGEVPPSLVDSGHFEDLNNTKDWAMNSPHSSPSVSQPQLTSTPNTSHSHPPLSPQSNPAIENLRRQHEDEIRDIREKHNDKVDSLLQRITEANDRYYELRPKLEAEEIKIRELEQEIAKLKSSQEELRPKLETAEIRVRDLEHENENLKMNEQELRPRLETAESKIQDLEQENDNLKKNHEEAEEKHKAVYLEMYKKGQVAAQYETEVMQANKESEQKKESSANEELRVQLDVTKKELENIRDTEYVSPNNLLSAKEAVSLWNLARKGMYNRLVEQRKSTSEHDPEMTLQFLKSAIYYFLTDRENIHGHLAAIESILGFTDNEKLNIDKASYYWR